MFNNGSNDALDVGLVAAAGAGSAFIKEKADAPVVVVSNNSAVLLLGSSLVGEDLGCFTDNCPNISLLEDGGADAT